MLPPDSRFLPFDLDAERSFVRFTFPFAIAEGGEVEHRVTGSNRRPLLAELESRFLGTGEWRRLSPMKNPQVLAHIRELLRPDPGARIDAEYTLALGLTNDSRQRRFPDRGRLALVLPKAHGRKLLQFEVRDVDLYLFRIGVGFLVAEVGLLSGPLDRAEVGVQAPEPGAEDLVLFNHYFRRVREDQDLPRIRGLADRWQSLAQQDAGRVGANAGTCYEDDTNGREVVRDLLAPLGREGLQWSALAGDRLIPFTFALLRASHNDSQRELALEARRRILFCLRRGYDLGYEPAEADLVEAGNPEVIPTFRNVSVGGCSEGAAIVAVEGADDFVREGLPARARNTYFPLFILVLQQRLAAIHLAAAIAREVRDRQSARRARDLPSISIRALRDRLFDFIVRGWYAEVSHEPQHAASYALWQKACRVDSLLAEVKSEIEELDEYLHRLEADRQAAVVNVLTLVATPLVLAIGFWGMNFLEVTGISMKEPWVWAATGLFYALYLGVAGVVRWLRGRDR